MAEMKVTLVVEVDGHELRFEEEAHLSPMKYLPSSARSVERAAIRAGERAVTFLIGAYGDGI